ncbi:hypothetical protein LCGC14_0220090 [marine sediment metagenome]|uniref:Uncharacterized protein n=1 Tax=marine sediment metagenome TaxID=412755 RepID=A0A0F9UHK5_9ZZZZ
MPSNEKVDCPRCEGSGWLGDPFYCDCFQCEGEGEVQRNLKHRETENEMENSKMIHLLLVTRAEQLGHSQCGLSCSEVDKADLSPHIKDVTCRRCLGVCRAKSYERVRECANRLDELTKGLCPHCKKEPRSEHLNGDCP